MSMSHFVGAVNGVEGSDRHPAVGSEVTPRKTSAIPTIVHAGREPGLSNVRTAFLVLARDGRGVDAKREELVKLGFDYLIVCGEDLGGQNLVFREPRGKYDALNVGLSVLLPRTDIILINDVDTRILSIDAPLRLLENDAVSMVFCRVDVPSGPQRSFYRILDPIRSFLPIAASGELVIVRSSAVKEALPIPPTLAEDTWLLFKFRELGLRTVFCRSAGVMTQRTETLAEETEYKRRTVCGIYQSLAATHPGLPIVMFYGLLPYLAPTLILTGPRGLAWSRGIWLGLGDFLKGSTTGKFGPIGEVQRANPK